MVSGVSAGLGHYFGIDAVWVRIIFHPISMGREQEFLPTLSYGSLFLLQVTTSEKLEMTGEPVNISNIEKSKEEFENVSDKFKNADYDNMVTRINWCWKIGSSFGDFIMTIFKIFAKFWVILIMTGLATFNGIIYRHVYFRVFVLIDFLARFHRSRKLQPSYMGFGY
jgi:hypothetical protein